MRTLAGQGKTPVGNRMHHAESLSVELFEKKILGGKGETYTDRKREGRRETETCLFRRATGRKEGEWVEFVS